MFKLLLTIIIIYLLVKFYKNSLPQGKDDGENVKDVLVRDPNCGKFIPKERAIRVEFNGKIYYFCSLQCAKEYEEKLKNGYK